MGATIEAIEYVFPEKKISNKDLQIEFPDYDFKRFEEKVGIASRYVVAKNETGLDLAVKACQKLFERNINKKEVDYILYCTQSPEYILPTTACVLQDKLELRKNIGAFDFNLGCSGYTYGLSFAETYSKLIHEKDRTNRSIFGDAATATIISESTENNIYHFLFGTDGKGYDKLIVKNGASRNDFDINCELKEYGTGNKYSDNHLYMNGPRVFDFTLREIPSSINELLKVNSLSKDSVGLFLFHQSNRFIIKQIASQLKIPIEKIPFNIDKFGNTSGVSIPLLMVTELDQNKNYNNLLMSGYGAGLNWGNCLVHLSDTFEKYDLIEL
jgi:3-oxoacyl-[acyl-carrier-protein] synthase-3